MYKTCRIAFYKDGKERMGDVVASAMSKAGITMENIQGREKVHYGNWCLVPVLDNEAAQRLVTVLEEMGYRVTVDMPDFVLEETDLSAFKVGDKVRVQYTNGLAGQSRGKGTVYEFRRVQTGITWDPETGKPIPTYGKAIVIRRYRSRGKGWVFKPSDAVRIQKGW